MINIEVICKPRGCGKTYDLIMESARTGIPILTAYNSRYITDQARYMGVKIHQPMSVQEYKYFKSNRSLLNSKDWKGKLLIDEVDNVLEQLLGIHVETVTCTPDSMNGKEKFNMFEIDNSIHNCELYINRNGIVFENSIYISDKITDINIIVPNKVVEVTFADRKKEKMVCHEEDTFNLRNCLFIAIAKHLYKKDYTFEGIEWKAFELTRLKKYVKIVDSALKAYEKKQKDIARIEEESKAEQERIERKRAKRQAYKERRVAKREQEEMDKQIAIQREAYIQAMKCIKDSENVANN